MDLNGRQFGKYTFTAATRGYDKSVHVAATPTDEPGNVVGAMRIETSHDVNRMNQRLINAPNHPSIRHHLIEEHDSGQQRWSGGNMEPTNPHVSWLGIQKEHRNPTLLSGLAGVAFHLHGGVPYADETLSVEGSQISRHMAKTVGMKGHPNNPDMEPNYDIADDYDPDDEDDAVRSSVRRMGNITMETARSQYGGEYQGTPPVKDLVRGLRMLKPSKSVNGPTAHEGQGRLGV